MQEHLPEGFNVIDLHKSGYIQSEMALKNSKISYQRV